MVARTVCGFGDIERWLRIISMVPPQKKKDTNGKVRVDSGVLFSGRARVDIVVLSSILLAGLHYYCFFLHLSKPHGCLKTLLAALSLTIPG